MRFKQFLNEEPIGKKPRYKTLTFAEAKESLEAHCKDAMWMLRDDLPLFRGSPTDSKRVNKSFYIGDPTLTVRRSQGYQGQHGTPGTLNYYTTLMDNLPAYEGWPKRSKSFIAATSEGNAASYSDSPRRPTIIIPFDGVPIGVVPFSDIWSVASDDLGFNRIKQMAGLVPTDSWESFLAVADDLKKNVGNNGREQEIIKKLFGHLAAKDSNFKEIEKDFIGFLNKQFDPDKLEFKKVTTKTLEALRPSLRNNEVWIGGKCLFVNSQVWEELREEFDV